MAIENQQSEIRNPKIWYPYTKHSAVEAGFPVIVRGEGPYLFDEDGVRYLDAISSWWCCSLGHSHPKIVEAIQTQAADLQHSILGNMSHPRAEEFCDALVDIFPDSHRKVVFGSDGSSATEAALKVSLQYWHNAGRPEKKRFAALKDAYHGDTFGAVSVGYVEAFHKPFESMLMPARHVDAPYCAACPWGKDSETCDTECFEPMKSCLEQNAGELAAIIIEPLCMGAAGMKMYKPDYLARLAKCCEANDVLLIADEIAVGMGRTGKMRACAHAGIDPDITLLGKALTGGSLPLSTAVVKDYIYDTFTDEPTDHTFYHGHTFAGNPIACAAGMAALKVYRDEGIVDQAAKQGRVLTDAISSLSDLPGVSAARALGAIAAVDLEDPQSVRDRMLQNHNILVRPLGKALYLMLPLNTDETLVKAAISALLSSISC